MKFCLTLALFVALPFASLLLHAQDSATPATGDQEATASQTEGTSQSTQAPNQTVLTGVGAARPGVLGAERDQLVPEFYVIETAESNPNNVPDVSSVRSITRLLGSVGVERVRKITDLKLAYVGGAELFNDSHGAGDQNRQLQEAYFDGKLTWERTELHLIDAFTYLPEAPFGAGAFGGVGVFNSLLGGYLSGLTATGLYPFTPAQFASIGSAPRMANTSVVELNHRVTPRGTLTATAAYGFLHFLNNQPLPNANQTIAEVGYNYAVRSRDTAAVLGGYGYFGFSQFGQAFSTEFTELFWGHQFSPRLTLSGGAGPVVIDIRGSTAGRQLSWMAVSRLDYVRPRTMVSLQYLHYINGGSGFLLGAHSDLAVFELAHQLTRTWNAQLLTGYTHSTALEGVNVPGFTNSNSTLNRGYAGVRFSRPVTEHSELFVLYNYSQTDVEDNPYCSVGQCGRVARQQLGGIGFTWTPQPIRLP